MTPTLLCLLTLSLSSPLGFLSSIYCTVSKIHPSEPNTDAHAMSRGQLSSTSHRYLNAPLNFEAYLAAGHTEEQAATHIRRAMSARDVQDAFLLRVKLPALSPPRVWRELRVPTYITFHKFHKVLQIAFSWGNEHMYQFNVASKEKLSRIFGNANVDLSGCEWIYEYDMGDGWEHRIEFLSRAETYLDSQVLEQRVVRGQNRFCIAGEGHGVAENSGGECGWDRLKWRMAESGQLDRWHWDIVWTNRRLDHMWLDVSQAIEQQFRRELLRGENDHWMATRDAGGQESRERTEANAEDTGLLKSYRQQE
ncbi:hypothetical protein B0A55_08942 [Friedmanniomyces simplex]|uniref:Plasmid pRiA4b Orf3-like domain-containing protein n=1 Tax=Friedmanniomyces simplex TaxID=329884 RepID=A0A4U0WZX2_9PEZI|nr:hypothetical protein B0A55_08942 [Friedmanniomyces simplex]